MSSAEARCRGERLQHRRARDRWTDLARGRRGGQHPTGRRPLGDCDQLGGAPLLRRIHRRSQIALPRLGIQQVARIAAVLHRAEIWAVTSPMDEQVSAMFMRPFTDVQSAIDAALVAQGPEAQVLFLTEASITVPRPGGR